MFKIFSELDIITDKSENSTVREFLAKIWKILTYNAGQIKISVVGAVV